jgi:hypothetical protein
MPGQLSLFEQVLRTADEALLIVGQAGGQSDSSADHREAASSPAQQPCTLCGAHCAAVPRCLTAREERQALAEERRAEQARAYHDPVDSHYVQHIRWLKRQPQPVLRGGLPFHQIADSIESEL